jgi:hypothetical protein
MPKSITNMLYNTSLEAETTTWNEVEAKKRAQEKTKQLLAGSRKSRL